LLNFLDPRLRSFNFNLHVDFNTSQPLDICPQTQPPLFYLQCEAYISVFFSYGRYRCRWRMDTYRPGIRCRPQYHSLISLPAPVVRRCLHARLLHRSPCIRNHFRSCSLAEPRQSRPKIQSRFTALRRNCRPLCLSVYLSLYLQNIFLSRSSADPLLSQSLRFLHP
jgi:hypothetical protein